MNADQLRAEFPQLRERTYLAWHSLGLAPRGVDQAIDRWRATIGIGRLALGGWAEQWFAVAGSLAELLGAAPGSVGLFPSATAAQAAIAATVRPEGERDTVVIGATDFHSSRYLWQALGRRGMRVVSVAARPDGSLDPYALAAALDHRVAWVALAAVSSFTGARLDEAVIARAHAVGAKVLLDAYQAVGIVPIHVGASGVDALVGGTSKWLCGGELGLAFLYVRPDLAASLDPALPGWLGHADPEAVAPTFRPAAGAWRFQQGSMGMAPLFLAAPGLELVRRIGVDALRERSRALTTHLVERALERGLTLRTPLDPERRGGHVCFAVPDPDAAVARLASFGIDVDARAGFGVRVAPHPAHDPSELDRVIELLTPG